MKKIYENMPFQSYILDASGRSFKITSYHGTDSGSSRAKPDEVKMVLYSRGVWNALFSLAVYWKTDVYKNGRMKTGHSTLLCYIIPSLPHPGIGYFQNGKIERSWNIWEENGKENRSKKNNSTTWGNKTESSGERRRLKRYRQRVKQYRQNWTFQNNERKFYQ